MKKSYGIYNMYGEEEFFFKSLREACRQAVAHGEGWMVEVLGMGTFARNLDAPGRAESAEAFEARCRAIANGKNPCPWDLDLGL